MNYVSSQTFIDVVLNSFKYNLFKRLTTKSSNLFLRGGDIISYGPLVNGVHEESLTNVIEYYTKKNMSGFLVDVGANIGLTSCQNGDSFKKVVCFEPNPLCANILKTNLAISLAKDKFVINEFALGDAEGCFDLYVPKHNWGGAFVRSEANSYSDEVLALKDGFSEIESENYVIETVEVRSTEETFSNLFSVLKTEGLCEGVIKIDVEGFERVVLSGIAKTLPSDMKVVIVFENWDENFDYEELRKMFSHRSFGLKKIDRTVIGSKHSKIVKLIFLVFGADKTHLVELKDAKYLTGDIVVEVL